MVNFGERLQDELRHEGWESKYIQYQVLKKLLKTVVKYEVRGQFVAAAKIRLQFRTALEEDIATADDWFIERASKLFSKGVRLAKIVSSCLSSDFQADLGSLRSFDIVVMDKEATIKQTANTSDTSKPSVTNDDPNDETNNDPTNDTNEDPTNDTTNDPTNDTKAEDPADQGNTPTTPDAEESKQTTATLDPSSSPPQSKTVVARDAIDQLVAYRREVKAIIKFAVVNKEAVRKIVKKHDKNLGGNKYDSDRLQHVMDEHVQHNTEFSKTRTMPSIVQALDLVSRLRTQIVLKSSTFARYYESLLRSAELNNNTDEDDAHKHNNDHDTTSQSLEEVAILEDVDEEVHGSSSGGRETNTVPCPCGGYELNWYVSRPDDYVQQVHKRNQKYQDHACGKCLPCTSYSYRRWTLFLFALGSVVVLGVILSYGIRPERTQTLVYLGVIGAVILAFANGANDIANSMGTSVGAGALTLKQALVFGSIFEFFGAVTMGSSVAKTISKGVIDPNAYAEDGCSGTLTFALGMLCVLAGAGSTTLLATVYGLPISATHSIVGGLVAVGLAARGAASLGLEAIVKTMVAWVASPLLGGLTAALLHVVISKVVFGADNPELRSLKMKPIFVAVAVAVCACFMLLKGPAFLKIEPTGLAVVCGLGIGVGVSGLVSLYEHWKNGAKGSGGTTGGSSSEEVDGVEEDGTGLGESSLMIGGVELTDSKEDGTASSLREGEEAAAAAAAPGHGGQGDSLEEGGEDGPQNDGKVNRALQEQKAKQREGAEKPFVPLLILSALVVAFAHGGNDVGNAVGPLAVIVEAINNGNVAGTPEIPLWALIIGATGFVVGIAVLGERTISTVGGKITKLTPTKSFATQMGAAVAVLTSSVLGLPVSTSHCLVGAVVGIGIADRCMSGSGELNFAVLKKIFIGWAVTIPLAMLVSVLVYWSLSPAFFAGGSDTNATAVGMNTTTAICK